MKSILRNKLPSWAYRTVLTCWYAGLFVLVLYYAFEPAADFRYLRF